MVGPQTIPFLPDYIPSDVDVNAVKADVGDDGVSAPNAVVPGLRQVVEEAHKDGINLKVVVIDRNPPVDTPLRDIATEVGHAYPGSTVLVLSPSYAGTYSPNFDRVTLEAGQDLAKTGNPVQSAQNFVDQLETPDFPWTAMTIVVLIGAIAATVITRVLQVRGKRAARADASADATG
ncbi:MAG: hypothetical protein JWR37_5869 [Mycobacterium sp.]|jgi:hypothetical protein|nr:hypothetical protein [Mycobacterium sp.]